MPVAAVSHAGMQTVTSGSHTAACGIRSGEIIASFAPSAKVISAPRPTSLPVPAVVGTAMTGGLLAVILPAPPSTSAYSRGHPRGAAISPLPLAQTTRDPPPAARTPAPDRPPKKPPPPPPHP